MNKHIHIHLNAKKTNDAPNAMRREAEVLGQKAAEKGLERSARKDPSFKILCRGLPKDEPDTSLTIFWLRGYDFYKKNNTKDAGQYSRTMKKKYKSEAEMQKDLPVMERQGWMAINEKKLPNGEMEYEFGYFKDSKTKDADQWVASYEQDQVSKKFRPVILKNGKKVWIGQKLFPDATKAAIEAGVQMRTVGVKDCYSSVEVREKIQEYERMIDDARRDNRPTDIYEKQLKQLQDALREIEGGTKTGDNYDCLDCLDSEGAFTPEMINRLKAEYSKIDRIDPSAPSYTKLVNLLDKMNQDQLKSLADAGIKFVSSLARNRLRK